MIKSNKTYYRANGIYLNATKYDKQLIKFMCTSIGLICKEYIEYIYDRCVKRNNSIPSEYEFYKEVIKPKRDIVNGDRHSPYTFADRNFISFYLNRIYRTAADTSITFNARFDKWNKQRFVKNVISANQSIQELISEDSDVNCTFIYYARNKHDIKRFNENMIYKVPLLGRKIGMTKKFSEPPMGREKPTYFVLKIGTTNNEKNVYCCVQPVYGSEKNPYTDEDGFIILKKKGDKNNAYKKYLKG